MSRCLGSKFLDLYKPLTCMTFLCMTALRNRTAAHTLIYLRRLTIKMVVSVNKDFEIQKICNYGNVTSRISSL